MSSIFKMLPSFAHIIRDGQPLDVPTAQLVVGDIVDLNIGDKVPADMRLLSVDQMKVCTQLTLPLTTNKQKTNVSLGGSIYAYGRK
jgi:magnesium-transporting ATPase (P-type)